MNSIGNDDVRKCKEECERNLLGKILEIKIANYLGLKNTSREL